MLHTGARSSARRDEDGHYVPLDEQDVAAWAQEPMIDAEEQLRAALELGELGPYQLQAAIQSVHNRRALTGDTDWRAIAALYDGLVAISPSLGAEVARAAAHAECDGPDAGLQLLDAIADERLADYQPYWACRAHILGRLDRHAEAHLAATRAIGLTADPAVRAHLISRFHTAD